MGDDFEDEVAKLIKLKKGKVKEIYNLKSLEEYLTADADEEDPVEREIRRIRNFSDIPREKPQRLQREDYFIESKEISEIEYNKYDLSPKILKNIKELYFSIDNIKINNEKYIKRKSKELGSYMSSLPSFSKAFSGANVSPLGFSLGLKDDVSITAENIGEFAHPIVEYIRQTNPDYVVASDRGARLLGLAVFRLYNQLYGKFPTVDGTLRFRRFSKRNSKEETKEHLGPLIGEMLKHGKRPKVLVLDDWVASGGTKRLAQEIFDEESNGKIKMSFGVLVGGEADVSGHGSQTSNFASATDWRDDSNIIGVSYGDKYGSRGIRARPVRSNQAYDYRRRMHSGIANLVNRLREEKLATSA